MSISLAFFLLVFAGVINASYAAPMKYFKGWVYENIWFQFAIWTFFVIPWVFILIVAPGAFGIWASMPAHTRVLTMVGGVAFGIGQICFAFALHSVGMGLAFVLNIGIGTGLGFLLPLLLQHPEEIHTPFGLVTILGVALAIVGIVLCTRAGEMRDKEHTGMAAEEERPTHAKKGYWLGVLLAAVAGLTSAGQNFSFSEAQGGLHGLEQTALTHGATRLGAANVFWPAFLFFGFIPFVGYMVYLLVKNGTFRNYALPGTRKYFAFGLLMGLFWFGSLVFYSKASQIIGDLGPVIGWPLFMIFIILTSNLWGYATKEWKGVSVRVGRVMLGGVGFLVLAVVVIAYGTSLKKSAPGGLSLLPPHHTAHHMRAPAAGGGEPIEQGQ